MTTRKPFSIRTQNELNISNKAKDEKKIDKREMATKKMSTKIIKVNTRHNSKIYIMNKKENGENKEIVNTKLTLPSQSPINDQILMQQEDIENFVPPMTNISITVDQPHDDITTEGSQINTRISYSIKQLLDMEPKSCIPPPGFENWPMQLKIVKPRDSKPPKKFTTKSNLQKRSPMGETKNTLSNNKINTPISINNNTIPKNNSNESVINKESSSVVATEFVATPVEKISLPVPSLKLDLIPFVAIKPETIVESKSSSETKPTKESKLVLETDERRLDQRQKQIDLGKKTLSYYMYCKKVPIYERKKGCPFTPRKNQICSKRSWDGQVRKWRRMLHEYDPKTPEELEESMRLFPEETKYLIQKRNEMKEGKCSVEKDNEDNDVF